MLKSKFRQETVNKVRRIKRTLRVNKKISDSPWYVMNNTAYHVYDWRIEENGIILIR